MTTLYKSAFVGQLTALGLVLAVLLLPMAGFYFILLTTILVLWFPVAKWTGDTLGLPIRVLLLLLVCTLLLFSEDFEILVRSHDATEWIIILPITWLICVLCIPDSLELTYPLGFLSCISLATVRLPTTPYHLAMLLLAVALLVASGSLLFLSRLRHPSVNASLVGRAATSHFSSHLLVLLFAASLMLISVDWVRKRAGHLTYFFPDLQEGGNNSFALETDAPRFNGKVICSVTAIRGSLPVYIADRFFLRYEKGQWLGAKSCFLAGGEYGLSQQAVPQGRQQNLCLLAMARPTPPPLVPFGALRSDAAQVERWLRAGHPERVSAAATFEWRHPPHAMPYAKPQSEALLLPDLTALKRKAGVLCANAETAAEKVAVLTDYLRSQHFYDRETAFKTDQSMDPAEYFLFKARRGWCVHFASAATLMLRAVGIPARFVVGYLTDPSTATAIDITDRAGHAWCEAYVQDGTTGGWVIVDPSMASPPNLHLSSQDVKMLLGLVILATLGIFVYRALTRATTADLRQEMRFDGTRSEAERILAAYHRVLRYLERLGVYRRKSETPREFATQTVPARFRDDLLTVTEAFERVKYMGYTHLGDATTRVEEAQCRILGLTRPDRKHVFSRVAARDTP